jgi:hypothetical protein
MSKFNDRDFEVGSSPRIVRLYDITNQQPFTASIVSYPGSNCITISLFDRHTEILQEVTLELDHGQLVYSEKFYDHG